MLHWIAVRNRILGSASFQRWAARLPFTRGQAQRHARALFDLVAGFVYSQVTYAMVTTGAIARLREGPATTEEVARAAGLAPEGAERLLKAAAALGLAERTGAVWMLGPAGAALASNGGIAAMIAHHDLLYRDLADPVALLRRDGGGGALSAFWPYAEGQAGAAGGYSALMAASQPMVAAQVIEAYDFARHKRLLDVGGGEGAFVAAVRKAAPRLDCAVFDLPEVAARAGAAVPGIETFAGSFLADPLPRGFDCLTLIRILHDHDDAAVATILAAARAALALGGALVIGEPMAEPGKDARVGDAYFGFYLLAMGSGRARAPREYKAMLHAACFDRVTVKRSNLPLVARVIVAR